MFEEDRHQEALACHDCALALDSEFAEAHSNRGNALRALKRLAEAEAAYRRALQLRPSFADGWNNLGTVLRDLKRPQQAHRKARALNGLTEVSG
jgi:protein O-GlcNAc transferase